MEQGSRYIVGIDLGTTNCALAYVDTHAKENERQVQILDVPQLIAQGEVAARPTLPSFVYLPEPHEVLQEALSLPWHSETPDVIVGAYARDMAAQSPAKVVTSAKSWLCYEGLDRRSQILPWSREDVPRQLSPVQASQYYLQHLRDAWNHVIPDGNDEDMLENQEVILTVPASFDAIARELTVEAANKASLSVRLLEEPQAAFYAWLEEMGDDWRNDVGDGDVILVCDVGGGTTDFSLIAVNDQEGNLVLQRIAVGDHTLLGGDNMDLTLAYGMAAKIQQTQGTQLDASQIAALTHACRAAKEKIGAGVEDAQPLTILGRGSGVIAGTITTEITPDEMDALLIDGFFPVCDLSETPAERRKVGLRAFGLDYAADPALTRHLAGFIGKHSFRDAEGHPILPTAVLFNGGVTKSPVFQNRIVDVLNEWSTGSDREMRILERHDPDLAVSVGAAAYGYVQRTGGVRIKAGSAMSYYIGVESGLPAVPGFAAPLEALCVVNFGLEEGSTVGIDAEGIGLVVGEPTEFSFFASTVRQDDAIGDRLAGWTADDMEELPPLIVELPVEEGSASPIGTLVPVKLRTVLTEIGTLQLWCEDARGGGSWKLEFELRGRNDDEAAE